MKALVYKGPGQVSLEERPTPKLADSTDAIVRVTLTTVCGTDLHIIKGDVATCSAGRILGHEGVGIIEQVGSAVRAFKKGDKVLISCMSSCATCEYCKRQMPSQCLSGGWILGNSIDGTQAEYVRIPHADSSLYAVPGGADEKGLVMLSDAFPTGLEVGVLCGKVEPGKTVVIIGSGPVGLAALITAQLYSPALLIMSDRDGGRLEQAKKLGATHTINGADVDLTQAVKDLTGGKGCDVVIEAVGIPATFEACQELVAPGGTIANVGVHGKKVDLHLEALWSKNITITANLVNTVTIPMLLQTTTSGKLNPQCLVTHEFSLAEMEKAYGTFGAAAQHNCLKVLIDMTS